jgi:hypothetical protein
MRRAWGIKLASYLVFSLIMALMALATFLVLCFFLPFVALKALWVLILGPVFAGPGRKGGPAPAS